MLFFAETIASLISWHICCEFVHCIRICP